MQNTATVDTAAALVEAAKRRAAYLAVDEHVSPATTAVLGVGSGSTVIYAVDRLRERRSEFLPPSSPSSSLPNLVCVPTSFQARNLIIEAGFVLGDVDSYPVIDVCIDGADEVDAALNVIKGGGAAHLREKVVAAASKKFIVIADFRKDSQTLGEQWKRGVPVEVIPYAYVVVSNKLKLLGGKPVLRPGGAAKAGPAVTDNGNFILDVDFGLIYDPARLERDIKMISGVVEVGIFSSMVDVAYFGGADGSVSKRVRPDQMEEDTTMTKTSMIGS